MYIGNNCIQYVKIFFMICGCIFIGGFCIVASIVCDYIYFLYENVLEIS